MIKRITWISWTGLGLLVISIISIFVVMFSTTPEPVYKSSVNSNELFYLPLALLSSVAFAIFLIKSKSMPKDQKKPWLFFSVASFSFFTTMLLNSLLIAFKLGSYESFIGILISQGITWIGLLSIVLILIGFDSEASKNAWKDRKTIMWPFYLALAIVFFLSMRSWITLPFSEILSSVFVILIPSVLCIRVINLTRNEPIPHCYKVFLVGFIISMLCSIAEVLVKIQALNIIEILVNLFCVVVATDIRTNIWLKEQS